jgi:hypothetical protein
MEQHPSNISKLGSREIDLEPKLFGKENAFRAFCRRLVRDLKAAGEEGRRQTIEQTRREIELRLVQTTEKPDVALQFACSVVVDVVAQGWKLKTGRKKIQIQTPEKEGETPDEIKGRVRAGHLLERDAQLREPAVAEFIKGMEQRRLGPLGWVSIFSLMRDGRDLEKKLSAVSQETTESRRAEMLRSVVAPYLQAVETDAVCSVTGLKLIDIWRYFRHTWVSTYKSLPGRSMMLLVRDAAAPFHPVIGIAALGSSMAQQTERDEWIGWDSDTFIKKLADQPTAQWCRWVYDSVDRLLNSIYQKDFLKEGLIEQRDLKRPTENAIGRLLRDAARAAEAHRLYPAPAEHKSNTNGKVAGEADWEKQSKTQLFRAKRAKTLALLLSIRRNLQEAGLAECSSAALRSALTNPKAKHAIRQLVRLVKAEHVGVDMMDIIICGAIAPYNVLLGGKLVCLMLPSPEVVQFYRARYGSQHSIIASSMKGAPVVREPNLVLLATTSLYGVGSSQYNRIRVPLEAVGGKAGHMLEYDELGMSRGFGSYHFSKASLDYLDTLVPRGDDSRKVNSIFGEGVNPLMRKLRDGLAGVGLPADELLMHGNPRVVYGVSIAENFREVLLGRDRRPKYFLSLKKAREHSELLAEFWRKRWLTGRIMRPGILETVKKHTLSYPITHGARVRLPEEGEGNLFEQ